MTKRYLVAGASILVLIPMLAFVCFLALAMTAGGSAGGTLSTGRSVMAYSDSLFLSSKLSADTATIKTGGKTIVVKPASILVDGVMVGAIDESTADVEILARNGTITFIADGQTLSTAWR